MFEAFADDTRPAGRDAALALLIVIGFELLPWLCRVIGEETSKIVPASIMTLSPLVAEAIFVARLSPL
jgi:hypothetical protein